jgi:hypothetical protein
VNKCTSARRLPLREWPLPDYDARCLLILRYKSTEEFSPVLSLCGTFCVARSIVWTFKYVFCFSSSIELTIANKPVNNVIINFNKYFHQAPSILVRTTTKSIQFINIQYFCFGFFHVVVLVLLAKQQQQKLLIFIPSQFVLLAP